VSRRTPALVRRYWDVVTKLGCAVTGETYGPSLTIHHCHGGSIADRGFTRSEGRKTSDWLVICLRRDLHLGPNGIDGWPRPPVRMWEAEHGLQAVFIDRLVVQTGIDVWEIALAEERGMVPRADAL
jgi:hypothetical protein